MKKIINLHSLDNSAESVIATAEFTDRSISLNMDIPSYGNFGGSFKVYFNSVDDLWNLINNLQDVAIEAEEYFESNP